MDGYLGEPGLISAHKTTLRKASPSVPGAWHQDGSFMGPVRSLNLWLSLSRCGDVAPGLDIVPRRLDHLVDRQTDEAMIEIQVSQAKAEEAAGDTADPPADLRARRRAVLRRDVPAPDGVGPVDAASPLRDRELVLRELVVPGRLRAGRDLVTVDPYSHDPARWGASLAHSAELLLPCLDAAGARSVVEIGRVRGRPDARARRLGGGSARAR